MSYVNRKGGRVHGLDQLAKSIWQLMEDNNAKITAFFIPSEDNLADQLSRQMSKSLARELDTEWMLKPELFQFVCQELQVQPDVDLFASGKNFQLERFCSWNYVDEAEAVDAFSFTWDPCDIYYVFPPFALISRILQKARMERSRILLIHPVWTTQPWWPTLIRSRNKFLTIPFSPSQLLLPQFPHQQHRLQNLQLEASWFSGTWRDSHPGHKPS